MTASNAVHHRRVATSNTRRSLKNRAEIHPMDARQLGGLIPIGLGDGGHNNHNDDDGGDDGSLIPSLPLPPNGPVFTRLSSSISSTSSLPTHSSTTDTSSTKSSTSSTKSTSSSSTTSESPTPTPTEGSASRSHTTAFVTVTTDLPANSSSPSTSGNTGTSHAGPIVGGILGAALGIAVIVFIFRCLTRRRQKSTNPLVFDPREFRRSGIMIHDPPMANGAAAERGMTPRPPSIIEKKLATPAPASTYSSQVNAAFQPPFDQYGPSQVRLGQRQAEYTGQYGYPVFPQQQYGNFSAKPTPMPPAFGTNPYGAPSFSPLPSSSPTMAPAYDSQFGETPGAAVVRQGSATSASYSTITRQSSATAQHQPGTTLAQYTDLSRVSGAPATRTPHIEEEPIDSTRSDVTTFHAAQYAEIPKRLNTEPPARLSTPIVEEPVENMKAKNRTIGNAAISNDDDLPPVPPYQDDDRATDSPFADPSIGTSTVALAPPPPIYSTRLDPNPPMLPEITIPRVSVNSGYDFPELVFESTPTTTPLGRAFPSGISGVLGPTNLGTPTTTMGKFPLTPSPLTSSFSIPSPPVERATFVSSASGRVVEIAARSPTTPAIPNIAPAKTTTTSMAATTSAASKRPDTLYDPADAYGGI